jgi:heme/copper-type cytochrome/quinol oxidase subunit 2
VDEATTAGETTGVDLVAGSGRGMTARSAALWLATATLVSLAATTARAVATAEIEVRISRRGFEPARLTLRKGETVRLVLSSGDGAEHCFAVDGLRVEKRVRPGQETRFDLTPERAGVFAIHCCLAAGGDHSERGELTVLE